MNALRASLREPLPSPGQLTRGRPVMTSQDRAGEAGSQSSLPMRNLWCDYSHFLSVS